MDIHKQINEWELNIGKSIFENSKVDQNAIVIDFRCGYVEYSVAASKHLALWYNIRG